MEVCHSNTCFCASRALRGCWAPNLYILWENNGSCAGYGILAFELRFVNIYGPVIKDKLQYVCVNICNVH